MESMGFSGVLGQDRAKRFLKGVLERDKIPHAYLFTGIPGVGKTRMAKALAAALNCRAPIHGDSCGSCPSCRQIRGGNSPDFMIIAPEGRNIKIEQIRELNRALGYAPVSGRYRLCVVQQAETMTEEAANSFLKTLEEPPPGNVFILKAVEPLNLLPTIVSRCQRVPFQPLSTEIIAGELEKKNGGMSGEKSAVLAQLSEGSLGRALRLCEGDFMERRQKWLALLSSLPSLSGIKALEAVVERVNEEKKGDQDRAEESGAMEMFGVWKTWYRDLLVAKVGGSPRLLMNGDFLPKLQNLQSSFTLDQLVEGIRMIDQAQSDLRRMRNSILAAGELALGLHRLVENRDFRRKEGSS